MKKSRFTDSQIMSVLKQLGAGVTVAELSREHNVSTATLYQWRAKCGGMDLGRDLVALAWPQDGVIEALRHQQRPWLGIMWHPERDTPISNNDQNIIKEHFQGSQ